MRNVSCVLSADRGTTGTVALTKEQARIVKFATDPSNWDDLEMEAYSGEFHVDIDNPMEIENKV